jgi:hypothetical protein
LSTTSVANRNVDEMTIPDEQLIDNSFPLEVLSAIQILVGFLPKC